MHDVDQTWGRSMHHTGCSSLSKATQKAHFRAIARSVALGIGVLTLGSPLELGAENPPIGNTVLQTSRFPLGIDPGEKDFSRMREAICKTVTAALPPGMIIEKAFISNDFFNSKEREINRDKGIQVKLYARLYLAKDGLAYAHMVILATANAAQAEKACATLCFPYGQSADHIAVLFSQQEDFSDYETVIEICKKLGLVRLRK